MTSWRPYLCPKTMKRRPCLCPKPVLWELNSFLMQTLSFVPINLHRRWPREWKHSILILMCKVKNGSTPKYITDLFQVHCDSDRRYNLRNSDFALPVYNTVTNGEHSIRYLGPLLLTKLTKKKRIIKFLSTFRTMKRKKNISAVVEGCGRDCNLCST